MAAYLHPSGASLLKPEGLWLILLVEGLLKVCHSHFQGFRSPDKVKLPLMSFWIQLLPAPVHHLRIGEGTWLLSIHNSVELFSQQSQRSLAH